MARRRRRRSLARTAGEEVAEEVTSQVAGDWFWHLLMLPVRLFFRGLVRLLDALNFLP